MFKYFLKYFGFCLIAITLNAQTIIDDYNAYAENNSKIDTVSVYGVYIIHESRKAPYLNFTDSCYYFAHDTVFAPLNKNNLIDTTNKYLIGIIYITEIDPTIEDFIRYIHE